MQKTFFSTNLYGSKGGGVLNKKLEENILPGLFPQSFKDLKGTWILQAQPESEPHLVLCKQRQEEESFC